MTNKTDLLRKIRLALQERPGSPGFSDPLGLEECLHDATQQVARETDCFFTYFDLDVTGSAGSPGGPICLPAGPYGELYKIKRALLTLSDGTKREFRMGSSERGHSIVGAGWMSRYCQTWESDPESGTNPDYLVLTGYNLQIYPLPTWAQEDGLRVFGFGTPGRTWDLPSGETDPAKALFPLPAYAEQAVSLLTQLNRIIQYPNDENMRRLPMIQERYDDALADTQSKAFSEYRRGNNL